MSLNFHTLFGHVQPQGPSVDDLIRWGDHLAVGHPEIDAQHKGICDLGARIYDIWRDGESIDVLRAAVDKFANLLEAHFSYEERLLAEIGYDRLDQHAMEHKSMLGELRTIRDQLLAPVGENGVPGGSVLSPGWPVIRLILGFGVGHIMTSDLDYSKALDVGRHHA